MASLQIDRLISGLGNQRKNDACRNQGDQTHEKEFQMLARTLTISLQKSNLRGLPIPPGKYPEPGSLPAKGNFSLGQPLSKSLWQAVIV